MTKDEYEFNYNKLQLTGKDTLSKLYITSLEARIAELEKENQDGALSMNELYNKYMDLKVTTLELEESKSCDGCKFGKFGVDSVGLEVECELNWNCSIAHVNRYEPKDSK